MKNYPRLILMILLCARISSCASTIQTSEFYGRGVGNFSDETGSHADLLALIKSTGKEHISGGATGKRGITIQSKTVAAPKSAVKPASGSTASGSTATGSAAAGYSQNYAVVIGVDDYRYWPKLGNARNDAYAMEQMLKGLGYIVYNLYDRQATRAKIQSTLTDVIGGKAKKNDRVLIFYAGHGHTLELDNGSNLGYIVPVDGKTDEYGSMISMTNLLDWSRIIQAHQLLYIMDSCYSGTGKLTEFSLKSSGDKSCKSRQIITAGEKDQQVFDSTEGGIRHSVFTNHLITALRDGLADTDGDKLTSATELGQYLKDEVSNETNRKQVPDFGQLPGHNCSDYVFYPQEPDAAEANVYSYCDISPEHIDFESLKQVKVTGTVNRVIFNPVYNDVVAVATSSGLFVESLSGAEMSWSLNRPISSIVFSPNGNCLAVIDSYSRLSFHEAKTGREVFSIKAPISRVKSLAFSPKASKIAIGGVNRFIVWDIKANIAKPMLGKHEGNVHSLYFVNKKQVFSVSDKLMSKLWNLNAQQEIKRIDESTDMNQLISADFSADGSLMALGVKQINIDLMKGTRDDKEFIRLRNTDTGDDLWTFEGHDAAITSLSFHPNKDYFASGSTDKNIRFWDIRDRKQFKVIPANAPVEAISFSPNGCMFAAAGDGMVSIWRLTEDRM